jgi:mono/diheme cytochrome c family protein
MLIRSLALLTFLSFVVSACDKHSKEPNVEFTQDMMRDASYKAQDFDPDKPGKRANMLPPPGTVPMNWTPYPNYQNDEEAKAFPNTLVPNKEILARGERKFQIYCSVCHGTQGYGDGRVAEKTLVKPPSLMSEKIRGWTDGQINHLITKGRGMMGSYESQIPSQEDRWALVHYIRHLQKSLPVEAPKAPANEGK